MRLAAALALGARVAGAQAPDSVVAGFVAAAGTAAARYADRSAAIADGYRLIGPDFPSMGQHYVSVALVARGAIEPGRPQILEYVMVGGHPVLAGLAWAVPRSPGQPLPAFPPVPNAWHYHTGTVDDESFIASHAGLSHAAPDTPTLAVMHAWIGLANPAGMFATDNWALPWMRLGLVPPPSLSLDASRMLSLASEGAGYFMALATLVAAPDSTESRSIRAAIDDGAQQARDLAEAMRAHAAVTAEDIARLSDGWQATWMRVANAVNSDHREALERVVGLHRH